MVTGLGQGRKAGFNQVSGGEWSLVWVGVGEDGMLGVAEYQ